MLWALQKLLGQKLNRPKYGRSFILFLTLCRARKPNEQGGTQQHRDEVSFGTIQDSSIIVHLYLPGR
jgi:hypothetical protein